MSWEIEYTDKWSGNKVVHKSNHSEGEARRATKDAAVENNCKAVCTHIADSPYSNALRSDNDGSRRHVVSEGDNHV